MSDALSRAHALLQIERPLEAARELSVLLTQQPQRADAHALLAAALLAAERGEEALESAKRAVGLAPEHPYCHRMLGAVLCELEREKQALASARTAIELDPEDVDGYALEARCLAGLSRWKEMLASAERGLALDPTEVTCIQLRAHALRMLGRTDEAASALDVALAEEPNDTDSHSAYGFTRLQSGDVNGALAHFREALRLDPKHEAARKGFVEALKARNPLYKPFLWWLLLSARLGEGRALLVMYGVFWAAKTTARVLKEFHGFTTLYHVVIGVCALLAWTTWVGMPLFDLMLWVRRDTRELLEERDRRVAQAVGATVLAAPLAAALMWATAKPIDVFFAVMAFLVLSMTVSGAMTATSAKARRIGRVALYTTLALAVFGTLLTAVEGGSVQISADRYEHTPGPTMMALSLMLGLLFTWGYMIAGFLKSWRKS